MELRYLCPDCRQTLTTDSALSGQSMRCPNCRTSHVIPARSTVSKLSLRGEYEAAAPVPTAAGTGDRIAVECDHCHREFRVRSSKRGAMVSCPKCGEKSRVGGMPSGDASRDAAAAALQIDLDPHGPPAAGVDAEPSPLEDVIEILELAPDFIAKRGDDVAQRERVQKERAEHAARERKVLERAERDRVERERVQQEQVEQAAREREALERAERETAERQRAQQELAEQAARERDTRQRAERERQEQAEREVQAQARREAEEQERACNKQAEQEAQAREARERQQKRNAERRQAEITRQREDAERQAAARRQAEEQRQAEQQLRLAEQARRRALIEQQRQAKEELRRQQAEEQTLREASRKQEEQTRQQRWRSVPARAKQLASEWSSLQPLERQQRFELLDQRRTALNRWQYCTGSDADVDAAFRGFVEFERRRWVCDRLEIELHAAVPLAQKHVVPLRNRLGADLVREFTTPVGGRRLQISCPVAVVAATPARASSVDKSAFSTGLEFLLPSAIRAKMLESVATTDAVQQAANALFWFLLPPEAIGLLREPADIAAPEALAILETLAAGEPNDFEELQPVVRHGLAVYWLNVAVLREAAFIAGFCRDAVDYWDIALEHWRRVLDDDAFWKSAGQTLDIAAETLDTVRAELPWLLSAMVLHLARAYGRCGDSVSAERLIGAVRRSDLPEAVRNAGAIAAVQGSFH